VASQIGCIGAGRGAAPSLQAGLPSLERGTTGTQDGNEPGCAGQGVSTGSAIRTYFASAETGER